MVWNYNQVYMLHKDRTHCMSNHVRKYIWDQTNRNYHCCLKSLNFPRWKKNFQEVPTFFPIMENRKPRFKPKREAHAH